MARFSIIFIYFSSLLFSSSTYYVKEPLEPDTVLSAWIVKQSLNPNFKIIKSNEIDKIDNAYLLNTSKSPIRRNGRFTAFEMALKTYKTPNSICINTLRKNIKIIELTPWKKLEYIEVLDFEQKFVNSFESNDLKQSFKFLNNFCKGLE